MLAKKLFSPNIRAISVEFFPPKTAAATRAFQEAVHALAPVPLNFVSVTFGAGGATREGSLQAVSYLRQHLSCPIVAHLTCVGLEKSQVHHFVEQMMAQGVQHFLVLRGDLPKDAENQLQANLDPGDKGSKDFPYAYQLLQYLKQHYPELSLGVAGFPEGHPETPNRLQEMAYLKQKVAAGADFLITQLCYDTHLLQDFRSRCQMQGIHIPISAGILPITASSKLSRIAELARGSYFPSALLQGLSGSESGISSFGAEWARDQVNQLSNFEGIHWYMLNNAETIRRLLLPSPA